jgi:hypothetical protein
MDQIYGFVYEPPATMPVEPAEFTRADRHGRTGHVPL